MKLLRTAGVLLLAGFSTASCTGADAPAALPSAESSASASPSPTSSPSASRTRLDVDSVGSDGLTVRYQGANGRIETLRVEDFRR